jgi:hypothetical protein
LELYFGKLWLFRLHCDPEKCTQFSAFSDSEKWLQTMTKSLTYSESIDIDICFMCEFLRFHHFCLNLCMIGGNVIDLLMMLPMLLI